MGTFRFKQFSVTDDEASLKVGTDAVLLGAWVRIGDARRLLDVGTGSGVIAMMLAQRSHPQAQVDAIDIQPNDVRQALRNVERSPWPDKITVVEGPVQQFNTRKTYDLIVSNPPYFSGSLLPPDPLRTTARHDATLTYDDLLLSTKRLLTPHGRLGVIIPYLAADGFVKLAESHGLYPHRLTRFITREGKKPERALLEFGFTRIHHAIDYLTLYASENQWSDEYRKLTGNFYLT
jgi:tRNA1Val (adenine37-N6)-methyltransferase